MLFGHALQVEVAKDYEHNGTTLRILLAVVKDAVHIEKLCELAFQE